MKAILIATLVSAALAVPTFASAVTEQQNLMKTCNADARTKALKGDERKKFMSACLSN